MSVYPAWDFGFWPKKKPNSIYDFEYKIDGLSELVNWGIENNMYMIHHCLFFPNKYFPKWFWETNYTSNLPRSSIWNEIITIRRYEIDPQN